MAALLFVLSAQGALAAIGETEAQCVSQYGEEFDLQDNLPFDVVGDKAASFTFKAYGESLTINVIFLNEIDSRETIRSTDASRALSDKQKNAILDSESAGLMWKRQNTLYRTGATEVTYGTEKWIRSDGAIATCWMSRKVKAQSQWGEVDFSTREYAAAQGGLDRQDGAN